MTHPTQDNQGRNFDVPYDPDSWLDTGMLFGAAVVALVILGVVEFCRLPVRLWRSIK